ncbi:hypothetical protein [Acidipropionibacterium jensenii]|uniref:hypothetical protein n=1 Tax=Acidipropionibacterium jensenii TaxID=1749 RepID=UPI00214B103E|nr:hypothetical protein [Acidipropionibacterium jensenii]
MDNTRLLAAKSSGVSVQANAHNLDDAIPRGVADRFRALGDYLPVSRVPVIENRISGQDAVFGSKYPSGSMITGWKGH